MTITGAISIYCPHCHKHTSIEAAPATYRDSFGSKQAIDALWEKRSDERWWIGVCNFCRNPVLVLNNGDTVFPHPMPEPTDETVPLNIRVDLDEAKQCFAVSAWRATAVMARRALQSATIDKGASKGKQLMAQIGELASQGKITTGLKEMADVIRWVGNDAAHPESDAVDKNDAEDVLDLAKQVLYVLYVAPAKAKKLRNKKGK